MKDKLLLYYFASMKYDVFVSEREEEEEEDDDDDFKFFYKQLVKA